MKNFIKIDKLSFKYLETSQTNIIDNLSLEIEKGKITVIIGSSGCGKSTAMSILAGIYPENGGIITGGEILIEGKNINEYSKIERTSLLTMVFQNPDLQFCMGTLRKEMIFCLENLSINPKEMDNLINSFAAEYNIYDLLDRKLHTLSGGEKQKAALACLLLIGSKGIILDEPFANIDPKGTKAILENLREYHKKNGTTVLAIDHRLDYWLDIADEIIVLGSGGKLLMRGINKDNILEHKDLFEGEGLFFPTEYNGFKTVVNTEETVVEFKNFSVAHQGNTLISDCNFSLKKGSITCVLGESGCGKTTMFLSLLKQNKYSGDIFLKGKNLADIKSRDVFCHIGMVFQNPANQFIALNVLDEVKKSILLQKNKISDGDATQKALQLLDRYSLKKYQKYSPYMLSQGQQRRLAVLSVLAGNQSILILDEPTYGQDQKNTDAVMSHLKELCQEGLTVIFSTHDKQTALRYSDVIYDVKDGGLNLEQD